MVSNFIDRIAGFRHSRASDLVLFIAPRVERLPLSIQAYDEPFLPFSKAIINASKDLVCAYMFDMAAYLAIGAAGAIALERAIRYAREDAVTILHGPFIGAGYAELLDERSFGVDSLTLADTTWLDAYRRRPDRSAFVVRSGSPKTLDAPSDTGFFWQESSLLSISGPSGSVLTLRVAGDSVLYAGMQENHTEQMREALKGMRDE